MSLKEVKKFIMDGGIDMLKDFSKECSTSKDEFVGHSLATLEAIWDVNRLEDWDDLIKMIYNGELGILGYGMFDDLMQDVLQQNNQNR